MFLTYINELVSVLKQHNIKVKLFADDVKISGVAGQEGPGSGPP